MNISLPESLKSFVDEQLSQRGFGISSEYVHELIRRTEERRQLQGLLLEGASSEATQAVTPDYFDNLRDKASNWA
jgi:antitoxin ParD1/3/4